MHPIISIIIIGLLKREETMIDIMTLRNEVFESLKTATSYGIDHEHGQAMVHAINAQNKVLFALL